MPMGTISATFLTMGYVQLLDALEWCLDLGISCVSVYAFSIDNFKRPPQEVAMLMQLAEEKLEELMQVTYQSQASEDTDCGAMQNGFLLIDLGERKGGKVCSLHVRSHTVSAEAIKWFSRCYSICPERYKASLSTSFFRIAICTCMCGIQATCRRSAHCQ